MMISAVCANTARLSRSRYTGKERDAESGNDYFGARYYASSMGRWLSPDPSGLKYTKFAKPQSLNLYAYAWDSPLTKVDPNGKAPGDVYAVTPSGFIGFFTSAGQIALGANGSYQHVAIEIGPDAMGNPQIAQEAPGGANINPLKSFLQDETSAGSYVDVYSPNVALSSSQISGMTNDATSMVGTPYNYSVEFDFGSSAMQCAQYVNFLTTSVGAATPIADLSFAGLAPLPSEISDSSTYTMTGLYTPAWSTGSQDIYEENPDPQRAYDQPTDQDE
jgi:RHS repeat-associated protein